MKKSVNPNKVSVLQPVGAGVLRGGGAGDSTTDMPFPYSCKETAGSTRTGQLLPDHQPLFKAEGVDTGGTTDFVTDGDIVLTATGEVIDGFRAQIAHSFVVGVVIALVTVQLSAHAF